MPETIQITKKTCKRCGYTWWPKTPENPLTCANKMCRSPYWDKNRTRSTKKIDNYSKDL